MQVVVEFRGFPHHEPGGAGGTAHQVPEGTTVAELLSALGFVDTAAPNVVIGGKSAKEDDVISENAHIMVFPRIAGG